MAAPAGKGHSLRNRAIDAVRRLRDAGHVAYFAGGCVRDELLGRTPKDHDIATSATPAQVTALFPHTREVGKAFGVVLIIDEPYTFEVATFRKDMSYADGRRPTGVTFAGDREDAQRRDFTINGLFLDPIDNRVIDYVGGQADLASRTIRAIGNPDDRFNEDHLRLLRAVRFASTLDFRIEDQTLSAIQRHAAKLRLISMERVQQELTRLLTESVRAGDAVRLLDDTGLLAVVLPEVSAMKGVEQPPKYHPEGDVFTHTMMMLDGMKDPDPVLAWSVLLHDVGKPSTFARVTQPDGSDRIRFDGHAEVGARIAGDILHRLRFSNDLADAVTHCVRRHMTFMHVQQMKKSTLRHFIAAPTFDTELELHRLDCLSSHGGLDNHTFVTAARDAFSQEPVLPAPWVTGRDIIALGVTEGPEVGVWRQKAFDRQLEGLASSREELLDWVRAQLKARGSS